MLTKIKYLIGIEMKNFLKERKLVNGVEKAHKMTHGALNLEGMEAYLKNDKKKTHILLIITVIFYF